MPTAAQINSTQGTRLGNTAPWDSYDAEMTEKLSPEMAAAVAEYSKHRYSDAQSSNQAKEQLAEQKELSDAVASQYQWLKPEEYADYAARIGTVMTHGQFITKLRNTGVNCWYTQHVHPDKAVLHVSRDTMHAEVVCWVQQGQMPELSMMHFDEHGVPLAERRRGWRTCLLQAILKGVLTEAQADKTFGRPRQDEAFSRYNATLQSYRKAGSSLGE